tara:strand:- start:495 stop:1085 length:591 start_codon:yes stop_codon:yes gene_type:complete
MKKLSTFLLLSITLLSLDCFSQIDEAILFFKDGDSIQGYAELKENRIKFRASLDSESDIWTYKMIEKIEFEGVYGVKTFEYIPLQKGMKPVLLELVVEGEVSLYKQTVNWWTGDMTSQEFPLRALQKETSRDYYFKRKNDAYPYRVHSEIFNAWKKRTIEFFKDCPELVKRVRSHEFDDAEFRDIVYYYNDYCAEF